MISLKRKLKTYLMRKKREINRTVAETRELIEIEVFSQIADTCSLLYYRRLPLTRSVWDCTCPRAAGAPSGVACPAWSAAWGAAAEEIWAAKGTASTGWVDTGRPWRVVAGGRSAAEVLWTAKSWTWAAGTAETSSVVHLYAREQKAG